MQLRALVGHRRAAATVVAALLFAGSSACSGGDDSPPATTTSSAVPVETTTTTEVPIEGGEQIFVYEPQIGDCFDLRRLEPDAKKASTQQVDIVLKLDCGQPHRYEVFDVLSYPNESGGYPGEQGLQDFADTNCTKAFDGYVGQTYELSEIEISFWTTIEQRWDSGEQPFACTLYDPAAGLTVGSLAGSGR